MNSALPERQGLYDPINEHDACGVGFVAHISRQKKSCDHRAGVADPEKSRSSRCRRRRSADGGWGRDIDPDPRSVPARGNGKAGVALPRAGDYGAGMVFLPKESASRLACQEAIERAVSAEGQVILGWRDVPVDRSMPMSPAVRALEPVMRQVFIGRGPT